MEPGDRLLERAKTMRTGADLTEEEAKAFKARKELECGIEGYSVLMGSSRW
jgi:hypothetical protein